MQIRTSEVFDYVKKLEQAIGDLQGEVATLKQLVVSNGLTVSAGGASITGDVAVTGTITGDGGLQTFGADDSGGAGFRQVLVPNA